MWVIFVLAVLLAGATGASLELASRTNATVETSQAERTAGNVHVMAVRLDRYVQAHPTAQSVVSATALALPSWYHQPYPGVTAYAALGRAYIYQSTDPVAWLRDVSGPGVKAGIKQGSNVTDMTGRKVATLAGAAASQIPNGSAVLVVRGAAASPLPPAPPGYKDAPMPPPLVAGAALPPPEPPEPLAPAGGGAPVPWVPTVPAPPLAPPAPADPPPPVPIDLSDLDVSCQMAFVPVMATTRPISSMPRLGGGLMCTQSGNFLLSGGMSGVRLPSQMDWVARFLLNDGAYSGQDWKITAVSDTDTAVTCRSFTTYVECKSDRMTFDPRGIESGDQRRFSITLTIENTRTHQKGSAVFTALNQVCGVSSGGMTAPCF